MGIPKSGESRASSAVRLSMETVEPGLVLLLPDQWVFAASGTDPQTLGVEAAALPWSSRHFFLCVANAAGIGQSDWIATTSRDRFGRFRIPELHKDGYPPWVGRDSFCKVDRVYTLRTTLLGRFAADGASTRRNFVGELAVEEVAWWITDWAS